MESLHERPRMNAPSRKRAVLRISRMKALRQIQVWFLTLVIEGVRCCWGGERS
jgi:hypothetical protein